MRGMMKRKGDVTITMRAAVDRYGDIAERWPHTITLTGSQAQIDHYLKHGTFCGIEEPGCDYLYGEAPDDAEE